MPQTGNSLIHYPTRKGAGRGFTLVEMLVTIGIIVVLVGLALVALHAGRGKAEQARMAADLQTIATALDAYKSDFGDYPRVTMDNAAVPRKFPIPLAVPGDLMNSNYISGAEILCWALIGPYAQNPSGGFALGDGADGPGFRLNNTGRGQVYPSYLNVERFRFGPDSRLPRYPVIQDSQGSPILYFPLTPKPAGQGWTSIADRWNPAAATNAPGYRPAYDFRDNEASFYRGMADPLHRMRTMLGDRNNNGAIDGTEAAPPTLPYLLWSAGPDGLYGPTDPTNASEVNNCDDVTNIKY